jgi:hypothetical protein
LDNVFSQKIYAVGFHIQIIRELKQHLTSLTITSPSIQHHFLFFFVYLRFVTGLVLLTTNSLPRSVTATNDLKSRVELDGGT